MEHADNVFRRNVEPVYRRRVEVAFTAPAAGGTVSVAPFSVPSLLARADLNNPAVPQTASMLIAFAAPAGVFAFAVRPAITVDAWAASTEFPPRPAQFRGAAEMHLFQLPLGPPLELQAVVTTPATATGNPERVTMIYDLVSSPMPVGQWEGRSR